MTGRRNLAVPAVPLRYCRRAAVAIDEAHDSDLARPLNRMLKLTRRHHPAGSAPPRTGTASIGEEPEKYGWTAWISALTLQGTMRLVGMEERLRRAYSRLLSEGRQSTLQLFDSTLEFPDILVQVHVAVVRKFKVAMRARAPSCGDPATAGRCSVSTYQAAEAIDRPRDPDHCSLRIGSC